jgi:FixJ family two-component response regulator
VKSLEAFEKLERRERQIIVHSLTGTDDEQIAKAFKTSKRVVERVRAKPFGIGRR